MAYEQIAKHRVENLKLCIAAQEKNYNRKSKHWKKIYMNFFTNFKWKKFFQMMPQ